VTVVLDVATGRYYPKPVHEFWTIGYTKCDAPVYCAEMSEFSANGCPDPLTGLSFIPKLQRIPANDAGSVSDEDYFVTVAPSGVFIRLWND
jgi:hypothetical protein